MTDFKHSAATVLFLLFDVEQIDCYIDFTGHSAHCSVSPFRLDKGGELFPLNMCWHFCSEGLLDESGIVLACENRGTIEQGSASLNSLLMSGQSTLDSIQQLEIV